MKQTGKMAVLAGLFLVVAGIILVVFGQRLKWLGRLPGDIRIRRPGFSFYMPLTTMILASLILSMLIWVIQKFFK